MLFVEIRKAKYPKQKDFAKKINEKVSTISMWESGKSSPKMEALPKISEALDISVGDLVQCFTEQK